MQIPKLSTRARLWVLAALAITYTYLQNCDLFGAPVPLTPYLVLAALLTSIIAGTMFFTSIVPLVLLVVRLIRRKHPGLTVIWALFWAALLIVDMAATRPLLLNYSQRHSIEKAEPLIAAIEQYRQVSGTYPTQLDCLVPGYIEQLPLPRSSAERGFYYKNHDSTYRITFDQHLHGRTYRSTVYAPDGEIESPSYARTDVWETGIENWKQFIH